MNAMPEENRNIWAPWRMPYLRSLGESSVQRDGCFLCDYVASPERDAENLVVWRTDRSIAVMNRFPYTNGHLMIAPQRHVGDLNELTPDELTELMALARDAAALLGHVVQAQGFNIGLNLGRCAGAGLPGHVHNHVVPRWNGDTNFIPVLDGARVISQSLEDLYRSLVDASKELGLPRPPERETHAGGFE